MKKKRKHDKIVLLPKTKLKNIEFLISKGLTDSDISHDEFVSVNNEDKMRWNFKKRNILLVFFYQSIY